MSPAANERDERREHHILAGWLLFYHERKKELEEKRQVLLGSLTPGSIVKAQNGHNKKITDPVASVGMKLAELQKEEQWLKLVEDIEKSLPLKRLTFLLLRREYRYNRGRKGWTVHVQRRFAAEMAKRTGQSEEDAWLSSRETFWRWWNDILLFGIGMAKGRGLL